MCFRELLLPELRYRTDSTMASFDVKLLPCGLRARVAAPTLVHAAEGMRVLSPANEALVRRVCDGELARQCGDVDPAITLGSPPTRVVFGRDCAVHFVGFRGEEYHGAVRLWGLPDFYHRVWDQRAQREVGEGDLLVFAKYGPDWEPSPYNHDDSNEPHDPAAMERLR
jgi:hypothetical protein